MQSDEMDKKIQEAAGHHHPAYDEKAWAGMEKLLDKHLPQKKDDRRRFIFFLLLFLLLGSGAALLIVDKSGHQKKPTISQSDEIKTSSPLSRQAEKIDNNNKTEKLPLLKQSTGNNRVDPVQSFTIDKPVQVSPQQYPDALQNKIARKRPVISNTPTGADKNSTEKITSPVSVVTTAAVPGIINTNTSPRNLSAGALIKPGEEPTRVNPDTVTGNAALTKSEPKPAVTDSAQQNNKTETPVTNTITKNKKTKSKKISSFFVSLSASPDISAAGGGEYGKMKLLSGGGIGYTFKDRITIRTGFYSGRKIYSTTPDAYNPPASFWSNYPYLQKIDADCKVYEIPLLFSYNFEKSSRQHWFVTTGISSYLMKKEAYTYFYKYSPTSPVYSRQWTIADKNKHFFSVITLSAGYQRNINRHFFVSAEPYLKIPLSGVGFGKVKLNSAGVQFTMGIKPFVKKSK